MSNNEPQVVVVLVTCPLEQAAELASELVEARAAACVNILDQVRSFYLWKGEVCDDSEALLVIKTRADGFEALRELIVERHPYDVPEVIALPVEAGHAPYLDWVLRSTPPEPESD